MIERLLTERILRDLSWSPIVGLVGSRQVGKTTLARRLQVLIEKPTLYRAILMSLLLPEKLLTGMKGCVFAL